MVTTSRRAGRVTNKTKLLIYRGSDKVDLGLAEVIVWENQHDGNPSSSDAASQPHHVGAIGVESNELLEHHLQAALSSASLIHSRTATKPASPTTSSRQKTEASSSANNASLNYHIPTPDATGLVGSADFTALYQQVKYHEPVNYVRYSETVEESCSGAGGLGYCMDEDDEKWLTGFNAKAEGASGTEPASSPLRETTPQNQPLTAGRERRGKGKEKEKDRDTPLTTLSISEDTFEYVMGMMEKYVEDEIPMLHTDLAQMPQFPALEHLFSSPVPASFYPAYEVPKGLPDSKSLTRMARNIYHHWRQRREIRKGKSIFPSLNYDEANDGDPYVCFRRRDIRATRKTRRTDNYSVEKFQKLQYELQAAHYIVSMVQKREQYKRTAFTADKELWEAKWKFYETKRKWPSLGVSREEEEFITGRSHQQQQARAAENAASMNGAHAIQMQSANTPVVRKKQPDREKEERDRRERMVEMARAAEKGVAGTGRSMAPEHYKERLQALRQKLEDAIARRAAANADWDDLTDSSYQPLPRPAAERNYKTADYLLPNAAPTREVEGIYRPAAFRLRRGRGGLLRLDRRTALLARQRGKQPSATNAYADWLFPDSFVDKPALDRPMSIDNVDPVEEEDVLEVEAARLAKRRRLNEIRRYDADSGGAVGVGMGVAKDDDRVVIDDLDPKYIRHRVGLLQSEDFEKLYPDMAIIAQTNAILDTPVELPALPQFIRPEPPMVMPLAQQQAYTREQAERLQAMATQFAQQQAYQNSLSIQNQANHPQQQQQLHPMQPPQMQQGQQRAPFDASNGHASPAVNSQGQGMLPPQNAQQNGRPPVIKRPSSQNGNPNGQGLPNVAIAQAQGQARPSGSPTYNLQGQPMNGSPQIGNGVMLPNGKPIIGANGQMDPTVQRMLVARAQLQAQQQQQQQHDASNATSSGNGNSNGHAGPVPTYDNMPPESQAQVRGMAIKGGFSDNPQAFQAFLNHRHNARLMQQTQAKQRADQAAIIAAQQAQSQPHGQGQQGTPRQPSSGSNGNTNGSATPASQEATFGTPQLPSGQLNLKLPPHATKRLGNNQTPSSPAQRAQ